MYMNGRISPVALGMLSRLAGRRQYMGFFVLTSDKNIQHVMPTFVKSS